MNERPQSTVTCTALPDENGKALVRVEIFDAGSGAHFGFELSPAMAAEVARSLLETVEDATALGAGIQ